SWLTRNVAARARSAGGGDEVVEGEGAAAGWGAAEAAFEDDAVGVGADDVGGLDRDGGVDVAEVDEARDPRIAGGARRQRFRIDGRDAQPRRRAVAAVALVELAAELRHAVLGDDVRRVEREAAGDHVAQGRGI